MAHVVGTVVILTGGAASGGLFVTAQKSQTSPRERTRMQAEVSEQAEPSVVTPQTESNEATSNSNDYRSVPPSIIPLADGPAEDTAHRAVEYHRPRHRHPNEGWENQFSSQPPAPKKAGRAKVKAPASAADQTAKVVHATTTVEQAAPPYDYARETPQNHMGGAVIERSLSPQPVSCPTSPMMYHQPRATSTIPRPNEWPGHPPTLYPPPFVPVHQQHYHSYNRPPPPAASEHPSPSGYDVSEGYPSTAPGMTSQRITQATLYFITDISTLTSEVQGLCIDNGWMDNTPAHDLTSHSVSQGWAPTSWGGRKRHGKPRGKVVPIRQLQNNHHSFERLSSTRSNYPGAITPMESNKQKVAWYWHDGCSWQPFSPMLNDRIEDAYQQSAELVTYQVQGKPYTIHFKAQMQYRGEPSCLNATKRRPIKRRASGALGFVSSLWNDFPGSDMLLGGW